MALKKAAGPKQITDAQLIKFYQDRTNAIKEHRQELVEHIEVWSVAHLALMNAQLDTAIELGGRGYLISDTDKVTKKKTTVVAKKKAKKK